MQFEGKIEKINVDKCGQTAKIFLKCKEPKIFTEHRFPTVTM